MKLYWIHYRNRNTYRVLTTGTLENDSVPCVVYQNVDTKEVWVRPAVEFHGWVTYQDKTVPRFRMVTL